MLNEEKIKIMNKLAMYEQGEGKKYLPVSRYYRSDSVSYTHLRSPRDRQKSRMPSSA